MGDRGISTTWQTEARTDRERAVVQTCFGRVVIAL